MTNIKNKFKQVIGVDMEGEGPDMIAKGLLEGTFGELERAEPAELILVPAPFSLVCLECSFDGPDTREQAVADGWNDVRFTPEMMGQNYLGFCPCCVLESK